DGYDRYYHTLQVPNPTTGNPEWTHWQSGGNVWNVFRQMDYTITPPSMPDGTQFTLRLGADYRQINGPIIENRLFDGRGAPVKYTKTARPEWALFKAAFHSTGNAATVLVVSGLDEGDVSGTGNNASHPTYQHWASTKNIGLQPITGVSFVLYQKEPNAPKVNFDTVTLYASREYPDGFGPIPWSAYKVQYEIVQCDPGGDVTLPLADDGMGVWTPGSSYLNEGKTLTLPALQPGQYINQIIVTPMGTNGSSPGAWPSRNGICLRYSVKAWGDKKWPNGTDVPPYSLVPMGWRLYYNDDPAKNGGDPDVPAMYEGGTGAVYYTEAPYAQAALVSSNARCLPGATVNYNIFGYNYSGFTVGEWKNPQVMVRVPKIMTLEGDAFTGFNTADGAPFDVTATLTGSEGGYNRYSFQASYSTPTPVFSQPSYSPVFEIPVTFKVAANAGPGEYPLRVLVSDSNPGSFIESATLYQSMNNLPSDDGDNKSYYGLLGQDDRYYMMPAVPATSNGPPASTSLNVLSTPAIGVKTTIACNATDGLYVDSRVVPAAKGEEVNVCLTVTNKGGVPLTGVKLYNILPYNGDKPGSTGSVSFLTVTPNGTAAVKYTTEPPGSANVPAYGKHGTATPDLQTATFHSAWTSGIPTEGSGARAVFIDFGALVLSPGESLDLDMTFLVPDASDQTAYNQFRYSAMEVGDNVSHLNQNSPVAGFSTEAIAILYDGNLPESGAHGNDLRSIPDNASAFIGVDGEGPGKDSLMVSDRVPILSGRSFAGWNTKKDGSGEWWGVEHPVGTITLGVTKQFLASGSLLLYAQWTPKDYTVQYKPGSYGAFTEVSHTGLHYGDATPDAPATLGEPGWVFSRWQPATVTTVTRDATYTAQWERFDSYTVHYDTNGGAPEFIASKTDVRWDDAGLLPTPPPTRTGYVFAGWNVSAGGSGTDVQGTTPYSAIATDANTFSVTLKAQWTAIRYAINYYDEDGLTDIGAALPNNPKSYTAEDLPRSVPQSPSGTEGRVFSGWKATHEIEPQTWALFAMQQDADAYSIPAGLYGDLRLVAGYVGDGSHVLRFALNGSVEFPTEPGSIPAVRMNAGDKIIEAPGYSEPKRAGHDFAGWYTNAELTEAVTDSTRMPDRDQTIYAKWTRFYTVTFDGNGGVIAVGNEMRTVVPPQTLLGAAMPPAPTRSGYSFVGWYTAPSGGTLFTKDTPVTADITVWARWTYIGDGGGGGGGGGGGDPVDPPGGDPDDNPGDPPDDDSGDPDNGGNNGGNNGGGSTVPPPPSNGGSVVPSEGADNVYIELDENGTPLGEWRWDDDAEQWIFDEYPPQGNLPQTGGILPAAGFAYLWVLSLLSLLWFAFVGPELRRRKKPCA
ncbi:MAG: InlB B-repeat-containing protein, partial [Clostridiales Family XIII bacterium]|nr:InlB B-repeat-containing protein [Clostridiales Family XIII bacterium]